MTVALYRCLAQLRYDAAVAGPRSLQDPLRTAVAAKGVELSALFFVIFEHTVVSGNPGRRPRLVAPHGPSTAGGKMARQHLTLVPVDGTSGPTTVVGWLDPATRQAELRTQGALIASHARRFHENLVLSATDYGSFLEEAREFLLEQGFRVDVINECDNLGSRSKQSGRILLVVILLGATLVVGIAIGVAWQTLFGG